MALNKCLFMGNLTRTPELRYTPSGKAVCDVSMALNRRYKNGDEVREEVTYVDVTFWGTQAETLCKWLNKGDRFFCEAMVIQEEREVTGRDGQPRKERKTRFRGSEFQFMEGKRDRSDEKGGKHSPAPAPGRPVSDTPGPLPGCEEDEIPF